MVYERELAVNGAARHELGRLDGHVPGGLVGAGREEAAHRHQAGQTGRVFVGGVALRVQLAAQPAAHVSRAVEGAVPVGVYKHGGSGEPGVPQHQSFTQQLIDQLLQHQSFHLGGQFIWLLRSKALVETSELPQIIIVHYYCLT